MLLLAQNLGMTGVFYVALYQTTTGHVAHLWAWNGADNISTALVDGYLDLGGDRVALFDPNIDLVRWGLVELGPSPSYKDTAVSNAVYEVDDPITPTDIQERIDGGRDPVYPYEEP